MNAMEALGMVFGGGALGAGLSKLIDRLLAHRLARKDKRADEDRAEAKRIVNDVADYGERIAQLEKAAARAETSDQITFKALNALLSHAITGNATGEMRKVQQELVDSIIENH